MKIQPKILFFLILFLFFPKIVFANTLRISPALLKLELSPGKVTTQEFEVENLTDSPLPVKVSVEGFDSNDEDFGIKIAEKITTPLAEWINLDITDTIIPAKSKTKITATINIPTEVPLGGYYAVIFFDPLTGPIQTNQTGNQINARLGAIFLANIGITSNQNEAEITTLSSDKSYYNSQSPQVLLRVKNTGLNFFTAKPEITIDPLIGKATTYTWEEKTILPGKVRRWEKEIALPHKYALISKVTAYVSLENGQYINRSFYIYSFATKEVLTLLAITIVLFPILKNRQRLHKAVRIIFKGK